MEVAISNHIIGKKAMLHKLICDSIAFVKEFTANSSEVRLAETPNGLPDIVPAQEATSSVHKDTKNSSAAKQNHHSTIVAGGKPIAPNQKQIATFAAPSKPLP